MVLYFFEAKNESSLNQRWFAGGRILIGESFEDKLHRKVREDTGLEIKSYRFVKVYSRVFADLHEISIIYLFRCKENEIKLDREHSEYKLFKKVPKGLYPYLLEAIIFTMDKMVMSWIECVYWAPVSVTSQLKFVRVTVFDALLELVLLRLDHKPPSLNKSKLSYFFH